VWLISLTNPEALSHSIGYARTQLVRGNYNRNSGAQSPVSSGSECNKQLPELRVYVRNVFEITVCVSAWTA